MTLCVVRGNWVVHMAPRPLQQHSADPPGYFAGCGLRTAMSVTAAKSPPRSGSCGARRHRCHSISLFVYADPP